MGILVWIMVGLMAGSLAKLVMPGPTAGGMTTAIPLGIGGALIGGVVGAVLGRETAIGFDYLSLLTAMIGSLVVLFSYRAYTVRAMA